LSFHEFAHAFAAYKCGDPTAKYAGRMTLNPMKHFDPLGILMFALAGFGWAKPVPINPYNFDNYKKGSFWTSAAGVLTNYCMAFVFYPIFILVMTYIRPLVPGTYMEIFLFALFYGLFSMSLSFCVFNLLPLHPLDGFHIVEAVSERKGKVYRFLRDYGHYILLGLVVLHYLANRFPVLTTIDILGYVLTFAIDFFGRPITLFWTWLFGIIH
jgi:Zn-dependent protease